MAKPLEVDERWQERIIAALNGLDYGSVQIVVHEGRIVQIERTERKRFDQPDSGKKPTQAYARSKL